MMKINSKKRKMSAAKMVQSQGLGSRKDVVKGIHQGKLWIRGEIVNNPNTLFDLEDLHFRWDKKEFIYAEHLLIVMHKKLGEECSHQPQHHRSVFDRLPSHLIKRGVQAVGRLDVDTSGVLLFTDDGELNHKMCSPKYDKEKVYYLRCEQKLNEEAVKRLVEGVELRKEQKIFKAKSVELKGDGSLVLSITEGKYHQVRRMIAAIGNKVIELHRMKFAEYDCDGLKPGEWKILYDF